MKIQSDRFGVIETNEEDLITFPEGIIGFFDEHTFVLLRHKDDSPIGWLQSTTTAWLALPVVSVESLAYEMDLNALEAASFSPNTHSVMVVLHAQSPAGPTVNMLAPIVVNAKTRIGHQVIALGGAEVPFVLRQEAAAEAA